MTTPTERDAFEAWYRTEDADLEDSSPSGTDFDAQHMYWLRATWQASRKQALEDAAAEIRGMKANHKVAQSAINQCAEALEALK